MLKLEDRREIAMALVNVIEEAGSLVLRDWRSAPSVRLKPDGSPVTDADLRSESHIAAALSKNWPDIPMISEECESGQNRIDAAERFFVIDPLDGTREYLAGRDEFAINIGLIEAGRPTVGVLLAPARSCLVVSFGPGQVLFRSGNGSLHPVAPGPVRTVPVVLVSRSHLDPETAAGLTRLGAHDVRPLGSSLKFALLALGEADIYPRLGRTMIWDVAAGHAVVEAAGGVVLTRDGQPLRYDIRVALDNPPFIAARSMGLARQALRAFA